MAVWVSAEASVLSHEAGHRLRSSHGDRGKLDLLSEGRSASKVNEAIASFLEHFIL